MSKNKIRVKAKVLTRPSTGYMHHWPSERWEADDTWQHRNPLLYLDSDRAPGPAAKIREQQFWLIAKAASRAILFACMRD